MILGLSIENFTILHVAISLIAIVSGLVVLAGMLQVRRLPGWTALFLVTTILTSVTGFMAAIRVRQSRRWATCRKAYPHPAARQGRRIAVDNSEDEM